MINQSTYNQIVARFEAFASGHFLIRQFTHGSLQEMIEQIPESGYPLMHIELTSVEYQAGMRSFRFTIIFADLPRDKEVANEYQREAISDMIQIGEDLIAEIRNGGVIFGFEAEIDPNVIFTPFVASYTHTLAGVTLDLAISLPYSWTACDIPAEWSVPGSGSYAPGSGGGALLLKVNGTANVVQSVLDLTQGSNITIEDLGDGRVRISAAGDLASAWGSIIGNLSDQTDLQDALDLKADLSSLSAVAFSGDYNDLSNLPSIPAAQVNSDWDATSGVEEILNKPSLAAVATSGDYNDLANLPTIPSELRDLSDVDIISPQQSDTLLFDAPSNEFINGQLAAVAYSNDYNDLSNLPSLPSPIGDMLKSTYDTDADGIVDKAETIQIIVRNSTGSTLSKGSVVYLSGATGNRPNAILADASSEATSSKTIGIVVSDISNNSEGNVAVNGTLHDLDTSAFTEGATLWLSETPGQVQQNNPPAEPAHAVFIGYVARSHPNFGRIVIQVQNGYELNELHGVSVSSPTNNQGLIFNSASGLWENQDIPSPDWSVLSLTETSARYDNYSPAGWNDEKVIKINANYTDKVQVYSGISGGYAGRMVTIQNSSVDNLMLLEQNSTNSSAANRMRFQGRSAYFLFPSEQITLLHNGTDWGVLSGNSNNGHMTFDDMLGAPNAPAPLAHFGEAAYGSVSGTGAYLRNENLMSGGFGTLSFISGTTASGSGTLKAMPRSGFYFGLGSNSKYCVVARIRLDQLPTAAQDFVFGVGISNLSNATGITTSGSMSWYASSGNAFWRNYSANTANTLITDTTTSIAVSTNPIVLGTYHPNNLGDCVFFYSSDGGMTYAVSSRFVRVSNNYNGAPVIGLNKLVGTTSILATVDYVGITCKGGVI
jgi:hypothetical protein